MGEPELIELIDPEDDLSRQAFALYETSFPVDERDPLNYLIEGIRKRAQGFRSPDRRSHFWVAVDDGKVIGLSIYCYYRVPRLAFLYYLAIQPELRGRGLGAWLLKWTVGQLPEDAKSLDGSAALGLCWEVERPEDGPTPDERALRQRRINFYIRNGAILLDGISFTAPPLDEGLPPMPYHLMFMPVSTQSVKVDMALMQAVIDATLVYGYQLDRSSIYYRHAIASIEK